MITITNKEQDSLSIIHPQTHRFLSITLIQLPKVMILPILDPNSQSSFGFNNNQQSNPSAQTNKSAFASDKPNTSFGTPLLNNQTGKNNTSNSLFGAPLQGASQQKSAQSPNC